MSRTSDSNSRIIIELKSSRKDLITIKEIQNTIQKHKIKVYLRSNIVTVFKVT